MVAVRDCHTLEFLYLILLQISKFGGNIIIAGEVELNHLSFYVESPGAVKNDKFLKRLAAESPQMVSPKCTARIKRLYRCSLESCFLIVTFLQPSNRTFRFLLLLICRNI
jgi:hypothetical protein